METYHGTARLIPFEKFDPRTTGTGLVSRTKFKGFFFTSDRDNAAYFAEHWLCKVEFPEPELFTDRYIPWKTMEHAFKNSTIFKVEDMLDGQFVSDITLVPNNRLDDIKILEWEFIGDEEFVFELLDKFFILDLDDPFVNQDIIEGCLGCLDIDLDFFLSFPIFDTYFKSKE